MCFVLWLAQSSQSSICVFAECYSVPVCVLQAPLLLLLLCSDHSQKLAPELLSAAVVVCAPLLPLTHSVPSHFCCSEPASHTTTTSSAQGKLLLLRLQRLLP